MKRNKKDGKERRNALLLSLGVLLVLGSFLFIAERESILNFMSTTFAVTVPEQLSIISSSRRLPKPNQTTEAQAGNVTEITLDGTYVTRNWQGFYGEISGTVVLDDASNFSLYEWVLVDPTGEVYASRNHSISWVSGNILCANETHIAREEADMNTDSESSGNAVDGVNETFNTTEHPAFGVGNNTFTVNQCNYSTSLFVNDSDPANGTVPRDFNETLMWSESDAAFIYLAHINPNKYGFNSSGSPGSKYDFQMIVTEDGHLEDTSSTTYYFYTELE